MIAEKLPRNLDSIDRQLDALLKQDIVCPYCENAMPCGPETNTRSQMRGTLMMSLEPVFETLLQCDNEGDEQGEGACPSMDTNESFLLRVGLNEESGEVFKQTLRQDEVFRELRKGQQQEQTAAHLAAEIESMRTGVSEQISRLREQHGEALESMVATMERDAAFRTAFIMEVRKMLDMHDPQAGIMTADEQGEALEKLQKMARDANAAENRARHVLDLTRDIGDWKKLWNEVAAAVGLPTMRNGRVSEEEQERLSRKLRDLMSERNVLKEIFELVGWTLEDLLNMARKEAQKMGTHITAIDEDPEWTGEIAGPHELTQPHAIMTPTREGLSTPPHVLMGRAFVNFCIMIIKALRGEKNPTKPE